MKKCIGCGAILQNEDCLKIGYVNDLDKDYCQRCFKMIHYNQHENLIEKVDNNEIIKQLKSLKGQFVWIIDIFDFSSSLYSVLKDFYQEEQCLVIINKFDLLPSSVNFERVSKYILKYLKKFNIKAKAVITRGINNDFNEAFDNFVNLNEPIIMTGLSNVGKSTIINQLLKKQVVTTNSYPATTININEIITEKYHLYDTVGIINEKSFAMHLSQKKLKVVLPNKQVRPIIYQIDSNQSLAIAGLVRFDIKTSINATVIFYGNNQLKIHRGKIENADKLWTENYDKDLQPVADSCDNFKNMSKWSFVNHGKNSYCFSSLGFITVICNNCEVEIYCDKAIEPKQEEAMI